MFTIINFNLICYRTPPVTFESKFIDAYPDLYERLQESPLGKLPPNHDYYKIL